MTRSTRSTGSPTWPDIAEDVREQRAALGERTARFERLRDRQEALGMLRAAGVTAEHWRPVQRDLTSAGSLLAICGDYLKAAGGLLDGRRDERSLQRITGLLYGSTITLTPAQAPMMDHRPPEVASSERHYSLPRITELVEESLRTAESLLDGVTDVRDTADRLGALLDAIDASASGSAASAVARASVGRIRHGARSDPLAVSLEPATELELTLARQLCAHLASAINRLEAREAHSRERLAGRPTSAGGTHVPQAAMELHESLRGLEGRCERERRSDPPALADLAERIAAADESARPVEALACARADCAGGTLDPSAGICTTCLRSPRQEESG